MDDRRQRIAARQELQRQKREAAELARKEEEERKRLIKFEKAQKRQALYAAKMREIKRVRAEKLAADKLAAAEKRRAQRERAQARKAAAAKRKAEKKAAQRAKRASDQAKSRQRAQSIKARKMSTDEADMLAQMFHVNVRKAPKAVVSSHHREFLTRLGILKKELDKAKRAATQVQQSQRKTSYPITDAAIADPVPQQCVRSLSPRPRKPCSLALAPSRG